MDEYSKKIEMLRVANGQAIRCDDYLAVEEPMEIRLIYGPSDRRKTKSLAITMRTPGSDFELAVGFLVSEGIVNSRTDIGELRFGEPYLEQTRESNIVEVELSPALEFDLAKLQRNFYVTSSCGICGKASLEAIAMVRKSTPTADVQHNPLAVPQAIIHQLSEKLRSHQANFQQTGGLHGAGLMTATGHLFVVREDVGRHNAVDKVIGSQLLLNRFPLSESVLVLSGRASFELVQKSVLAQIPMVVAVGAPSSLAVELAARFGVTLIGFTSSERFNIYTGAERVNGI